MSDMDTCKHRWKDSPSDAGEGIYCTRCGDMANVSDLRQRISELEKQYNDLLYQVACKFPGESRHDTVKRYIQEAETPQINPPQTALRGEDDGGADR